MFFAERRHTCKEIEGVGASDFRIAVSKRLSARHLINRWIAAFAVAVWRFARRAPGRTGRLDSTADLGINENHDMPYCSVGCTIVLNTKSAPAQLGENGDRETRDIRQLYRNKRRQPLHKGRFGQVYTLFRAHKHLVAQRVN